MTVTITFLLSIFISLTMLLLGLFVYLSMTARITRVTFLLLASSMAGWVLTNAGADLFVDNSLVWTRATFAFGAFSLASFVVFAMHVTKRLKYSIAASITALVSGVVMAVLSVTSEIVPSITFIDNYSNVNQGPLFIVYVVFAICTALVAISALLYRYFSEDGLDKSRIKFILIGTAFTAVFALSTNLILPLVMKSNPLAIYGSFAVLVLIGTIAYSIIRHHLFNIRLATARAVSYVSVGIVGGVGFAVILFVLLEPFLGFRETTMPQRAFYIVALIVFGLSLPPLKSFFDRVTQKLFLRNMYDPEVVLAVVADIASDSSSSEQLMRRVTEVLVNELKLDYAEGYLFRDGQWHRRTIKATTRKRYRPAVLSGLEKEKKTRLIKLSNAQSERLERTDMGAMLVLCSARQAIGCIALSYKQNGTSFTSQDEQVLSAVADELAVAVENLLRYEEIERFNETLQQRIREATAQLRQTNKKLHVLDEAKDEFISMASHQLRTPLTSVKGYLSMVLDGDMGKVTPDQRKVLEEAFNSSQRMVYLISDFLNVSRIQTGKFELERTQSNLAEVLSDEIAQLKIMASSRNLRINYVQPSHFPVAYIDQDKFRQVMMNFIDNAIYYSNPSTTITISLTKEADDIVFKVMDQGIGVPAGERHKLFTKFYRASNAKKQRPDGTGIGLFMAQKVIVAHGGSIIFESKENQGSTFGFRLPLKDNLK